MVEIANVVIITDLYCLIVSAALSKWLPEHTLQKSEPAIAADMFEPGH